MISYNYSGDRMPFVLTMLAGLSTMIGTIFIFIKFKNENKLIYYTLNIAFSAMLSISILDLIPEGYNYINNIYLSILYIIIGFVLALFIDSIIKNNYSNNLYRVGVVSLISLILHNIPEGIITYLASSHNIKLGITLSMAIALHNIPEGISIAVPIYYGTKSRKKAFSYTLVSALSEPLAAFITYLFLENYINNSILGILLLLTAGIMIYIAIFELIKETKLNFNIIIITFIIIYFTIYLIN